MSDGRNVALVATRQVTRPQFEHAGEALRARQHDPDQELVVRSVAERLCRRSDAHRGDARSAPAPRAHRADRRRELSIEGQEEIRPGQSSNDHPLIEGRPEGGSDLLRRLDSKGVRFQSALTLSKSAATERAGGSRSLTRRQMSPAVRKSASLI
jgi:hypothetical protein